MSDIQGASELTNYAEGYGRAIVTNLRHIGKEVTALTILRTLAGDIESSRTDGRPFAMSDPEFMVAAITAAIGEATELQGVDHV